MIKENLASLKDLALMSHYYCEDSWYSCPKAADGCAKDNDGECDCGADEHNAKVLKLYADLMMELSKEEDYTNSKRWEVDHLRNELTSYEDTGAWK